MNPKGVNDLDPKLRETYERIMGTTPGAPLENKDPQPQSPAAATEPPHPILETHAEASIKSPAQSFLNPAVPSSSQTQTIKPNDPFSQTLTPPAEVITKNAVIGNPSKKKNGIMPMVFILIGVVFFIAYAVFWAKIFRLF
jgi:hypothetical protein